MCLFYDWNSRRLNRKIKKKSLFVAFPWVETSTGPGVKSFCGFSMGSNQYWAGRVYYLCVYYMTGTPEGSTESGFMEKPGIQPATPGLQGIALI